MNAAICALGLWSTVLADIAITDVRIETGDGRVLKQATVVVRGNRITRVSSGSAPTGMETIDGRGKVLTPGLVASYSHLGLVEVGLEEAGRDHQVQGVNAVPAFHAPDGYNPFGHRLPIHRDEGVTSAMIAPAGGYLMDGSGSLISMVSGFPEEPGRYPVHALFGGVGNRAAAHAGGARGAVWMHLRALFEDARFYAKNKERFTRGQTRPLRYPPNQLEAMSPLTEGKVPWIVHANRASDILAAIEFAQEASIKVAILGGAEAWRVADLLSAFDVPVIITPSFQVPSSFSKIAARMDSPALLHQAGVRVILGGRHDFDNIRRLRHEAGIAVSHGFPRARVLETITSSPMKLYAPNRDEGTVAKGKRATMVLWSGDPLDLRSIALRVWIDGTEQDLDNRQKQLARRYLRKR